MELDDLLEQKNELEYIKKELSFLESEIKINAEYKNIIKEIINDTNYDIEELQKPISQLQEEEVKELDNYYMSERGIY